MAGPVAPRTAIVGVGKAGMAQAGLAQTATAMASEAVSMALADAGLERAQIDGLVVHIGSPRGNDYDLAASLLGLNVRFAAQPWNHGRFGATAIQHAAMALSAGLADRVLCLAAYKNASFGTHGTKERPGFQESLRIGGGPHAETPYVGLTGPVAGAAMAFQRYCHKYNVSAEQLAAVALACRRHAQKNPDAMMQKDLTPELYAEARFIVEPLRLFDCSVLVDGAVALIMTSDDLAQGNPRAVHLLGMQGINAGPNEFIFGQPGLGINQAAVFDFDPKPSEQLAYRMAGLSPADVDAFYVYDAFSPLVLWSLERFGHCRVGEGMEFVQGGRIELGGQMPVNTNGGMLSEGHLNGWGHFIEMVRQVRGEAGPRQVAGLKVAQWGTCLGDSLIFGREPQA